MLFPDLCGPQMTVNGPKSIDCPENAESHPELDAVNLYGWLKAPHCLPKLKLGVGKFAMSGRLSELWELK